MMGPHRSKLIAMLLSLVLLCAAFVTYSSAASDKWVFQVGTTTAALGDTNVIRLPIMIQNNPGGFIDFQFTVKFDPNVLEAMPAAAVIGGDSMLMYAPNLQQPDIKEAPLFLSNVFKDKGEIMLAMAGMAQRDVNGNLSQYVFEGTGKLVTLLFKLKTDLVSIPSALSSVKILGDTAYLPFLSHKPDKSEITFSHAEVLEGGVTITGSALPSSIAISASGELEQGVFSLSEVALTASPTASGCYIEEDIRWYVNDEPQNGATGLAFTFKPKTIGSHVITARAGGVVSNPITVTVYVLLPHPDFDYEQSNGNVTILGYKGTDQNVVIPSEIYGMPVTKIGAQAFMDRADITSITLPGSIGEIMKKAFYGCTGLTELTLPASPALSMGEYAFFGCANLARVDLLHSAFEIPASAFEGCSKLASLYCYGNPPSVLGGDAFKGLPSAFTIYYLGTYKDAWSPNGETAWQGYPIEVFEIERLMLKGSSPYSFDSGYLTGVMQKTSVSAIIGEFMGGNIAITGRDGVTQDIGAIVGTGFKVRLMHGGAVADELTIVVRGDIMGNGKVDSLDIAEVQKHLLYIQVLEGAGFKAADLHSNGVVNSLDISEMQKILLGLAG